ncbi:MAG: V-type ATP synthase subunit D [Candidatus Omnitrophota bacterium]|nr:V-type ATP synthase subunit D [Candidatus Omnitrophota bacterium]
MSKIKLTKNELKRQRDSLKQYQHYLPTLLLKKQQMQMKILEAKRLQAERQSVLTEKLENMAKWTGLFADPEVDLKAWTTPTKVDVSYTNIAGANVPVFEQIHFNEAEYDFYSTPFWIDKGLEEIRLMVELLMEIDVIKRQVAVLEKELRITTQRVNLFEKVKIPECLENIRKIRIYLGDQMANAVGISKVAKKKVDEKNLVMVMG